MSESTGMSAGSPASPGMFREVDEARFVAAVAAAFEEVRGSRGGGAVYAGQDVPGLSDADPELFTVAAVSVSTGNVLTFGDAPSGSARLLIQSAFKPLSLAFALCTLGREAVERVVASRGGKGYLASTVEADGRAHNAMINSGALSILQLLSQGGRKVEDVLRFFRNLASVEHSDRLSISVNQDAYRATLADSAHNMQFCRNLGKLLPLFPDSHDAAASAVDFYSQLDCVATTAENLARVAAGIARASCMHAGGILAEKEARSADIEKIHRDESMHSAAPCMTSAAADYVISEMWSSGMYEASAAWSRDVGIPAKSGVSGVIVAILPGRFGVVAYSPRIDNEGNSVLGTSFFRALSSRLRPPEKRTICWIRHGQSMANVMGTDDESVRDAALSELGTRQAQYWSTNSDAAALLNAVDVCVCSPLRRAFQTASCVFQNTTNPRFSISPNRYAREKWWHLHQCRGVPHANLVSFLDEKCISNVEDLDSLAKVDEYWNPEGEEAIMQEKRQNKFRQLSISGLQRLKDDLRLGHGDARVIAVSCHWGVICELLDVENVGNAEILVTEMEMDTGKMRVLARHMVPETLRSNSV